MTACPAILEPINDHFGTQKHLKAKPVKQVPENADCMAVRYK